MTPPLGMRATDEFYEELLQFTETIFGQMPNLD